MPRLRARHDLGQERTDIPRPCDGSGSLRRQDHSSWHRPVRERNSRDRTLNPARVAVPRRAVQDGCIRGTFRIMGAVDNTIRPTGTDSEAASKRLAGVAVRTPLVNSPVLDDAVGARVFLKAETLQRTGSFKFRGA